jgi:outer membrane protein TolC
MQTMKLFRLFFFVAAASVAVAQGEPPATRTISMQDCIQQALEKNLDLQIERFNPQLSQYDIAVAQAGYDPMFKFSGQQNYSETGGQSFDPVTGLPSLGSKTYQNTFSSSIDGLLPWGLTYNLYGNNLTDSWGKTRGTNSFENTTGGIGIGMAQPLLKNFWIDQTRLNIRVAKNRFNYNTAGLQMRIMDTVTSVENAYYDLVAAIENVKVRELALELADRLLSENKKRVEVGALAPLDEKQAESQVASARADLLTARQQLASQQNVLKSLLTDDYQKIHDVSLSPSQGLAAVPQEFSLQQSWSKGMTQRPDLQQVKLDLERQGLQLKYDYNQLFPQLDLVGSYGYGAGSVTTVEFSDAFSDIANQSYPNYSFGAVLSIPLSNKAARNNYKAGKLSVKQALLSVKKMEQGIMTEIDNAIITAQASYERVGATRAASSYADDALKAEQKKLENGKSTSFVVLQLQKNLTDARSQEITALAEYNKSLAALSLAEGSTLTRQNISIQVK